MGGVKKTIELIQQWNNLDITIFIPTSTVDLSDSGDGDQQTTKKLCSSKKRKQTNAEVFGEVVVEVAGLLKEPISPVLLLP